MNTPSRARRSAVVQPQGAGNAVRAVLRRPGQPLPDAVRKRMERTFGEPLDDVRVHTDAAAGDAAGAVQATAFTSGSQIAFAPRAYAPSSRAGTRLLAHELAHVIQQRHGPVAGTVTSDGLSISDPSDAFEQAAERLALSPASEDHSSPSGGETTASERSEGTTASGATTANGAGSTVAIQRAVVDVSQAEQQLEPLWDKRGDNPKPLLTAVESFVGHTSQFQGQTYGPIDLVPTEPYELENRRGKNATSTVEVACKLADQSQPLGYSSFVIHYHPDVFAETKTQSEAHMKGAKWGKERVPYSKIPPKVKRAIPTPAEIRREF